MRKSNFCHRNIERLVHRELLTEAVALNITLDEYNQSALSHPVIFRLVHNQKMPAEEALRISHEDIQTRAIVDPDICDLIEADRMDLTLALSMSIEEIGNPVPYLESLSDKTDQQIRKLELYEIFPDIFPVDVEIIVQNEFNPHRTLSDDKELALLLDPQTRRYAIHMVDLEFFLERTEKNMRELDLLQDRYARDYTDQIMQLEFKARKTTDDEIALEEIYLKICCKIPYENARIRRIRRVLENEGEIASVNLYNNCATTLRFGPSVPWAYFDMGIFAVNNPQLMTSMKNVINRVVKKELVMCYLEMNHTPTKLIETDAMQTYIKDRTDELRLGVLKFFCGSRTPEYSENNLHILINAIREKLINKEFTLNCHDKIMDFQSMIEETSEVQPEMSFG